MYYRETPRRSDFDSYEEYESEWDRKIEAEIERAEQKRIEDRMEDDT